MDVIALVLSILALFVAALAFLSDIVKDFEAIARAPYRSILSVLSGLSVMTLAVVELALSMFNTVTGNLPADWSPTRLVLVFLIVPVLAIPLAAYLVWLGFRPYRSATEGLEVQRNG